MKKTLLALLLTAMAGITSAQSKFNVTGTIIEKGTNETVPSATVRVLSLPDSAMVTGVSSGLDGTFKITGVPKGKYALKVTFIGYQDNTISLDLTNKKEKNVDMGYLTLRENTKLLKEAVVSANAAQVQVSGDSLVYNASAYRVAEGSALEELVKKLPGAEIDDDGNITINGKTVKKIMVDGKEFFLNDTKVALKNIPTNIVDKIKSYYKKSDLAEMTGIDDGEEETVLDIQIKRGMNNGWIGNIDLGIGTNSRYTEKISAFRFTEKNKIFVFGSANNIGDRGFGGGGGRGWGRGGNGLEAGKMAGANFNTESAKLKANGNLVFNYEGGDTYTLSNIENFVTKEGAFVNSVSQNYKSNMSGNTDFRIEWKPDSLTNIIFRPSASISRNRGKSYSNKATFDINPYDIEDAEDDPYSWANQKINETDSIYNVIVNTNSNVQQTYSTDKSLNGELQLNRRLSSNGRNITFRFTGGVGESESKQLSAAAIKYRSTNRTDTYNNRYYTTPGKSHNYSAQITYSEPIAEKTYLQFSYKFSYSYKRSDRSADVWVNDLTTYNSIQQILYAYRYDVAGALDNILQLGLNPNSDASTISAADSLTKLSTYKLLTHTASIRLRKVGSNYNLSAGMDFLPQHSILDYKYMAQDYPEITRNVFNFSPTLDFKYEWNKQTQMKANYRGRSSQPSMENLLEIVDDSDPLNISMGNASLKPSFNHDFKIDFNTYNAELQQGIFTFANVNLTQNSISNETKYDAETGVKTTKPENINGNWNAMLGVGYNRGLGENKYFTFSSFSMFRYQHQVSYYYVQDSAMMANLQMTAPSSIRSTTNQTSINERLSLGFRKDWFEFSVNGNVRYTHSRNNIVTNNNLDTWQFSYGCEMNLNFNCGLSFSSDISESSRRGYSSSGMNTDELLWNAQISQSFLKGKALTVSLQWNDILNNRSNISRALTTMQSTDSRYNAIYSYGMLHVIYKLNIFGGKNANGTDSNPYGNGGGRPGGFGGRGGRR